MKFGKKTSNVLEMCRQTLEKNKKQLVFITEDNECYYWSSKGYSELSYNCKVVPKPKDNDKLCISIKNNEHKFKQIKDNKFYQFYYPTQNALRTIEGYNNKPGEIKVSGVYNKNGEIYVGKPIKKVKEQLKEQLKEEELKNDLKRYEELVKQSKSDKAKKKYETYIKKTKMKLEQNKKQKKI